MYEASAYGFVEISGLAAALTALDIMSKTSGIQLLSWERKWGGRLVTFIIKGDVAAVNEAIIAANENGLKKPVSCGVLPNPHPEIVRLANNSAARL